MTQLTFDRPLAVAAALSGAFAVLLGAFAAHGAGPQVKTLLTTGAHYLLTHAVLAVVCSALSPDRRLIRWAGWLAVGGGVIFALALAGIGVLGVRALGMIAPVGGLIMILAWLFLGFAALRARPAG